MISHVAPKISVVMPVYNGKKYLAKAIESFLVQDYQEKELVIVDGKSTDGSHEIIQRYCDEYSCLTWIKDLDRGLADATNIGIRHCSGEIIGYQGSDDFFVQGVFQVVAEYAYLVQFDAIYFNSYAYDAKKNSCRISRCPNLDFTRENLLSYGNIVGFQNIFFKRHIYEKYKLNTQNKYSFDYELYLELTSHETYLFLYIDRVCTIYMMDENISRVFEKEQAEEALRVAVAYGKVVQKDHTNQSIFSRVLRKSVRLVRHILGVVRSV